MEVEKKEIQEKITELVEEYEFSRQKIKNYLELLIEYPCVQEGSFEQMLECLELIVSERASQKLMISQNKVDGISNLKTTIDNMLNRIYETNEPGIIDDKHERFKGYDLEPEITKQKTIQFN